LISSSDEITKIGDATYSEVFYAGAYGKHEYAVMKIMPFGDNLMVINGTVQQMADAVFREVQMTVTLDELATSGLHFVRFLGCHLVQGEFPDRLLDSWDVSDKRSRSENDRPGTHVISNRHIRLSRQRADILHHYARRRRLGYRAFKGRH
jgi:hypothetical protein